MSKILKFFVLFVCINSFVFCSLETVQNYIEKGNQSTSYNERQKNYNEALSLLTIELQQNPSPVLYYALAQLYQEMGYYSFALLNLERARLLGMEPLAVQSFSDQVREKLGLPSQIVKNEYSYFYLIEFGFFFFLLLTLSFSFIHVWINHKAIKRLKYFFLNSSSVLLLIIALNHFSRSEQAMIVFPTDFYQQPSDSSPLVNNVSLLVGDKVKILSEIRDNDWIKIKNTEGVFGFIPQHTLRLL